MNAYYSNHVSVHTDGYLGSFYYFAMVNNTTLSILEQNCTPAQ